MVCARRLHAEGNLRTPFRKQTDDRGDYGQIFKKGIYSYVEVAKDRRNKRIRFTDSGKTYAQTVIPPAADAENLAMAELGIKKIAELVRLTAAFTENMEREFSKLSTI